MTPTNLAQVILEIVLNDLNSVDALLPDRSTKLVDAIIDAIQEYGEARYSEGFSDGEGAERESQEMMAV